MGLRERGKGRLVLGVPQGVGSREFGCVKMGGGNRNNRPPSPS